MLVLFILLKLTLLSVLHRQMIPTVQYIAVSDEIFLLLVIIIIMVCQKLVELLILYVHPVQ